MNSLVTSFLDFQYFVCFYATEIDYDDGLNWRVRSINATSTSIPWGYVDDRTGRDMCMSASGIRAFISIIPATVRFMQCLRRFRGLYLLSSSLTASVDTRHAHPHLTNAGKYATTYFVVMFGALNRWHEKTTTDQLTTSPIFYLWIAAYIVSFTYTFLWDIFMDWGLIDPKAPKDSPYLREEMIFGSRWYYYLAIFEDFVLRLSWVMNVSLGEAWTLEADLLMCITAPLELFRRFVWNYLRLENEHVNNCGNFRAVRDISVKPIRKGDLDVLISKIDQPDGVTHRGAELRNRARKQRRGGKRAPMKRVKIKTSTVLSPKMSTTIGQKASTGLLSRMATK